MKIVICDDDQDIVNFIQKIAIRCAREIPIAYDFNIYIQGKELYLDLNDGNIADLYLLDINMPDCSGMDIAKKIRSNNKTCLIVFITSYPQYAMDAFELNIFRYIQKSVISIKLPSALNDALIYITRQNSMSLIIKNKFRYQKIPYADVLFFSKNGKNTNITTFADVTYIRKSLKNVYEMLDKSEFIYVDKGYIVNIINISMIKDDTIYLKNNMKIPVSRPRLQEVKRTVMRYWVDVI